MTTDERNEVLEEAATLLERYGYQWSVMLIRGLKIPTEPEALANYMEQD